MENISKYISYVEATSSQTATRRGILNRPSAVELRAMKLVATKVFDVVREHFGVPLRVSSFFRCAILNKAVGGAVTSQHMKGEAIDIQSMGNGVTNADIFNYIKDNLVFDQLIWEYGDRKQPAWVHVSYKASGNRKQILYVG